MDIAGTLPDSTAVNKIPSCFMRNPRAADNLEGSARWRLLSELITHQADRTQRALLSLVAKGYLRERSAGAIHSLNPDMAGPKA